MVMFNKKVVSLPNITILVDIVGFINYYSQLFKHILFFQKSEESSTS